jgi:hypothetical protein
MVSSPNEVAKMKKVSTIGMLVIILASTCFSWQVKLIRKTAIKNAELPLLLSGSFVVMEDGCLIFADIKDKEHQFKMYDAGGNLIKAWGKMGLGPAEYGGLACLDYQYPYLIAQDAGKQRIHVFSKLPDHEFKKIGEIPAWEANNQIKLFDNHILICGFIVSPQGRKYMLFMRDFEGRETKYILPLENRYGADSVSGDNKIREEVSGISHLAFTAIDEDTIFYVSDVRLRIARVNVRSQKISFFGDEPGNFRALVMNRKTRGDLLQPGNTVMEHVLNNYSFISGIFADQYIVGVIYSNREKKIDDERYFVPYIQIYDHSGRTLYEQSLAPAFAEDKTIPVFYQKDRRRLFLLSAISTEIDYEYVIYEFSIEP